MHNFKLLFTKNICTILGLGNFSKMPGTLGSLVGLIIGITLLSYTSYKVLYISFIILLLIGIYSTYVYQTQVGISDKSEIIIDEVIGQLIPLFIIDLNIIDILLSFVLFRFFDIFKLYPANIIDRKYSNHYGVIFDDIIAGFQALIVIILIKVPW